MEETTAQVKFLIKSSAAKDVEKLLKEVGVAADKEKLDAMMSALKGKKLHEVGIEIEIYLAH